MRLSLSLLCSLLLAAGCATAETEPALDDSGVSLRDGTADALGVLGLLNDPATTFELLDLDVALDCRAAANLIDARPFATVAEVDAVKWVGDSALAKLTAYARDHGWVPAGDDVLGTFDGVTFTVDEALAALDLVNAAPEAVLHDEVPLDARAVRSIVAARPVATMDELAGLYYVGSAMLERIRRFVSAREIGVVSDLDKTVLPPHDGDLLDLPDAPYPGAATLYGALEGDEPGDVYYVTARPDWMVEGIPAWLELHGLPAGPIDTGVSPADDVARAEKVADISRVLDANPDQQFVLLGDTNHVDPDAYREILAAYPDRIVAAFVHDVKEIDPARLEGLILYDDFSDVAAILGDLGLIDAAVAQAVAEAVAGG